LQWKSKKCYIFWVCVCSLRDPERNTHAPYHIAICVLPHSTIFFHIMSQTARFSEKQKKKMNIKIFWSLKLLSETFLILNRIQRDMIKRMYIGLHVKYTLFGSYFNTSSIFVERFSRNPQIQNFMKIRSLGAELYENGQTETTELIVAFRYFNIKITVLMYFSTSFFRMV